MSSLAFFMLFFSVILYAEATLTICSSVKCCHDCPDIQFPFSVQGLQPQNCTYSSFGLVCRENKTMIQFPSYGDLIVKSISYDVKRISLLDPKNCVHDVFLKLKLSLTPVHYSYAVKNYIYLNCSAQLTPSFARVPCLSGFGYHIYVLKTSQAFPASCKAVQTVAIPFSYSPYLSDSSFGLVFTWDMAGIERVEVKGGCSEPWHARKGNRQTIFLNSVSF